jgi:hypothetical protein
MSSGLTLKKKAALAVNGPNECLVKDIPRGPKETLSPRERAKKAAYILRRKKLL